MHRVISRAEACFSPWTLDSGTALAAPLLYSLVRSLRPRTVVEYGSGYSTPFLAEALRENREGVEREAALLREKSFDLLSGIGALDLQGALEDLPPEAQAKVNAWLDSRDESMGLDPRFYLQPYRPRLRCFERLPAGHEYCAKLRGLLDELTLADLVDIEYDADTATIAKGIPQDLLPVDLAWNDYADYRTFFEGIWPVLNPLGGVMVFHYGNANFEADIAWMRQQRAQAGDLELVTLIEPHKLVQNGCFLLRRTSGCQTPFAPRRNDGSVVPQIVDALRELADQSDDVGVI